MMSHHGAYDALPTRKGFLDRIHKLMIFNLEMYRPEVNSETARALWFFRRLPPSPGLRRDRQVNHGQWDPIRAHWGPPTLSGKHLLCVRKSTLDVSDRAYHSNSKPM